MLNSRTDRFSKALTTALLAVPLLFSVHAQASGSWFASIGAKQTRLQINESAFQSQALVGTAGRWLYPGIGIQFATGLPLNDDSSGAVTVRVDSLTSVGLRFEGTAVNRSELAASLAFGGVVSQIDAASVLSDEQSTYRGQFVSTGLTFAIDYGSQVLLDYSYYRFESEVSISDISISYRRRF